MKSKKDLMYLAARSLMAQAALATDFGLFPLQFDGKRWNKAMAASGTGSRRPHDVGYGTTEGRIENLIVNYFRSISTSRVGSLKVRGNTDVYRALSKEERTQDAQERWEAVLEQLAA